MQVVAEIHAGKPDAALAHEKTLTEAARER
jgi:hypothetical protein